MSSIFDSLGIDPGIIIILLLILTIVLAVNVFRLTAFMKQKRIMSTTSALSNIIWNLCSANMALKSMMRSMM